MKKNRPHGLLVIAALCIALALTSATAFAQGQGRGGFTYEVTIYNLTGGQLLSPPLVVSHSSNMALFLVGEPAQPELATLAEEGDPTPLADLLALSPQVRDVAIGDGAVPPGGKTTITIRTRRPFDAISAVAMLSNTNDAFFGLDGIVPPRGRRETMEIFANAFDAGSETNNEACGFIPGPACDGLGEDVRDEAAAEGFIHIHSGVQGVADLESADSDWRNPVVKVEITRVR